MRTFARTAPAALAVIALSLTGCVAKGKDDNVAQAGTPGATAPSARDTLLDGKKVYDDAASVHLVLESENVPDDVDSVRGADGVGTHAPAFQGEFKARGMGMNMTIPVTSVDGKSYVKLPLTPGYQEKDMKSMGAIDPATLFAKDQGIDKVITETTDVEYDGDKKRDGNEVVQGIKGKVPGKAMKEVLGMGFDNATYDIKYLLTDPAHQITTVEVVGPFYKESENNTYRLKLDRYGEQVSITKP